MNKVLELKSKVLSFVQSRGPVIPIKVAKHFGSNTIFISAILSELISGNQVKLTKAKKRVSNQSPVLNYKVIVIYINQTIMSSLCSKE